jgi:ribosomal protein S18 acetylase RimI-like enzyme
VTYTVRAVSEADWEELRALRLRALADAPAAFATTLDEASALTEDRWRERARGSELSRMFLAFLDDAAVGMAGVYEEDGSAQLVSVWVRPDHRGTGVARDLITAVMTFAAGAGKERMTLWVTEANAAARRLYERVGFRATGRRQPMPSRAWIEEHEMETLLVPPVIASQRRA